MNILLTKSTRNQLVMKILFKKSSLNANDMNMKLLLHKQLNTNLLT